MSIRFSGDTEVRLHYDPDADEYRGTVVDPYLRFRGAVPVSRRFARDVACSDAYDDAARRLARVAQRWANSRKRGFMLEQLRDGTIRIRRGYQAPCPLEDL